jgi:HAD superfamily hydrolase (TIGR01490 family)
MNNLALFDLDHTLLPLDSDYEWGQFLCRKKVVDVHAFEKRNIEFYSQYQAGTMDPVEYLEFALNTLAQFPRDALNMLHDEFMRDIITPAILPAARHLLKHHQDQGDLIAIITATNYFVTAPIAHALGVTHLLAAQPEILTNGNFTGRLKGIPSSGKGKITHLENWLHSMNLSLRDFPRSYFYSDSQNDIPLLSIVTHPIATNPNQKLLAHAQTQGWPILKLFHD